MRQSRTWRSFSTAVYARAGLVLVSGFIRSEWSFSASFGRRLRCSSVADRCRYAPSSRLADGQNSLETASSGLMKPLLVGVVWAQARGDARAPKRWARETSAIATDINQS